MVYIFLNRISQRRTHTLKCLLLTVCLSLWMELTSSQGSNVTAAVGQTVTLEAPATTLISSYIWYRGGEANNQKRIVTYFASPPNQVNGPEYRGRETGLPNGSLQIKDVKTMDTGSYLVIMTLTDGGAPQTTWQLTVYVTLPAEPLPDWAIAVIVVVVLAVCAVTAFLVYWFKFRKPAAGTSNSVPMDTTKQKQPSTNAKPNGTADDVQYSSVSFVPKAAAPAKPATNENTVYSEVRR